MRRHVELLTEHFQGYERPARSVGEPGPPVSEVSMAEQRACRDFRKHITWYLKGYQVGGELRSKLGMFTSLAEFDRLTGELDADQPHPGAPAEGQRGRSGVQRQVALPDGWLADRQIDGATASMIAAAEASVSGG
jgi:hypothetical protein